MQICELLNFTPFFRFPGALGPWNTSKISDIMAGKLDPNTDIAVLTDDELGWLVGWLVFIISVRCLNSTKYKYQEGRTKRENKTEQRGRCN